MHFITAKNATAIVDIPDVRVPTPLHLSPVQQLIWHLENVGLEQWVLHVEFNKQPF